MKENKKSKLIFYGLTGLAIIATIILGATYAYFTSQVGSNNEELVTIGTLQIRYDQGSNITADNLKPATVAQVKDAYTAGNCRYTNDATNNVTGEQICAFNTFTITNTGSLASKVTAILTNITNTYANLKYEVFEGTTVPATLTGNIIGTTSSLIGLPSDVIIPATTNNTKTYTLLLWLDSSATIETDANKSYTATITVSAVQSNNEILANAPELAEGMIPIMYNGANWIKADKDNNNNSWYNYNNKMWANAVMVNTEASAEIGSLSRQQYMDADVGTTVLESDILAYYVWIPRYKYELFNPTYASGTSPQLINVVFESEDSTTGSVSCTYDASGNESCQNKAIGNYYTHPAFTFDGTELKGIWVGKFETTGDSTTPTIKSNLLPLGAAKTAYMFSIVQKFGTATYLTNNGIAKTNAHMMKNIEWGAVAYLKQSTYGLGNKEIGRNNYNSDYYYGNGTLLTGCGNSANFDSYSSTCHQYNTATGMLASTTGNVTGIYDTSGGYGEYVMGNYGKVYGWNQYYNSGFSEGLYGLDTKYYDLYAGDTMAYSHLGDATGETSGWYGDDATFVSSSSPWFSRGGPYGSSASGSFNSQRFTGYTDFSNIGCHVILAVA